MASAPSLLQRMRSAVTVFRSGTLSAAVGGLRFALPGQFLGARTNRQNTRGWMPGARSPNYDTIGDQVPLRARARDAVRNFPLAKSTIITFVACGIGVGLKPAPRIDARYLGLTDDQKESLERDILRHWDAWSSSRWSSFDGTLAFNAQQRLSFSARLINGDHWVIKRRRAIPGTPYTLSLQHIEADLVSTPDSQISNLTIRDGVEFDDNGVARAIYIANHYPHDPLFSGAKAWARVPLYDDQGAAIVLHNVGDRRAGQARGVTLFDATIETLKALADFAENELTAALNDSVFTVLFKSPRGAKLLPDMVAIDPETGLPITSDMVGTTVERTPKIPLGAANVVNIFEDESAEKLESTRPSKLFEPFDTAMVKKYAAGVGLPFELIMRHFTASFSASKGAIIEGWRVIRKERGTDIDNVGTPTWSWFLEDLAASGLVAMPGFFQDHLARAAYSRVQWSGPVPGHLNPAQEADAAKTRMDTGITTLEAETAEYNGSSWEDNHPQSAKEHRVRLAAGLVAPLVLAAGATEAAVPPPDPTLDEFGDPPTPEAP